jgi:hypothetical protein
MKASLLGSPLEASLLGSPLDLEALLLGSPLVLRSYHADTTRPAATVAG